MHRRKRFASFVFIGILLIAGMWLLFQKPTLAPETITRQQSLLQAYAPDSSLASDKGSPIETGQHSVAPAVEPVVVDFSEVKISTEDPDSMYNRWLRGDLDLDENDGIVSDLEMQKLVEEALSMPPSKNVQLATSQPVALAPISSGVAFDSMDYTDGGGSVPPDPEMAAGPNHVVATVNVAVAIYDKTTGTAVIGPTTAGSLFSQAPCTTGLYDPNVIYDEEAQRWFLAYDQGPESATGGYCVLASQTSDPTGLWNEYFFQTNSSGVWMDYPHAGVGDEYIFMGGNMFVIGGNFIEGRIYAFNKADLYAGNPVAMITQGLGSGIDTPQPLNLHGFNSGTWPAYGSTHYFLGEPYDGANYTLLEWDTTTLTNHGDINLGTGGLPVASVQSGGGTLDAGDFRPLDFEYSNGYGWTAMTISCNPGSGTVNCVRWAQIDLASSTPPTLGPAGSGVYSSDGDYRTFPDLAVNACDDMTLGYTKTSATTFPGIWVTGRESGDAPNTLQAESQVKAGEITYTSFEPSAPRRWGDYTGMTIDPDGLTFWYLGEYSKDTGTTDGRWGTYIASFNYGQDCTEATIAGKVTDSSSGNPIANASVDISVAGSVLDSISTDANGDYVFIGSVGTYDVTASAYGYTSQTVTGITTSDGVTTTQDFALSALPFYTVSGVVTDAATGWPLYASVQIEPDGFPAFTVWTNPETGFYSTNLPGGVSYTLTVDAWVEGYTTAVRSLAPLTANQTEDFALNANLTTCTAPGYTADGFYQSFDATSIPTDWTVVNNGGTCPWVFNDPGGRTNLTGGGGNFAVADSDDCGFGTTMDTTLYSPIVDVSSLSAINLQFDYDYRDLGSVADVDVSANGGATWTNIVSWNSDQRGPATFLQNVTPQLSGSTQAQVRFRYVTGWDWWWELDNIQLGGSCMPPTGGGLVVGNVYDGNTTTGLNGATVLNEDGYSASSMATPSDPNVADGFYTLYSPTGVKQFTASYTGYLDDIATPTVLVNSTIRQDFNLFLPPSGGMVCSTPNLTIPDNDVTGVNSTLTIPQIGAIEDVNLYLRGPHSWVGDLVFTLTHPNGTTVVTAVDRPGYTGSGFGCVNDNFDLWLDDVGTDGAVEDQCATPSPALFGRATPNNPLSALNGLTANGDWTLNVSDQAGGDTGSLQEWCLEITINNNVWRGTQDSDWNNPQNWASGAVPQATENVVLDPTYLTGARVWPILEVDPTVANLTLEADAELTIPNGRSLSINGTLTNNGLLRQTINNVNSATTFLGMGGYGGVEITPSGDMGSTTVEIRGNQDCTTDPSSQPVQRCFDITPTTARSATIRFYYLPSEANGNLENGVFVYHWNSTDWDLQTGTTHSSGADPHWVQVTGVSSYSPFVLDNGTPTAVSLAQFVPSNTSTATAVLLTAILLILMSFSIIVLKRKKFL